MSSIRLTWAIVALFVQGCRPSPSARVPDQEIARVEARLQQHEADVARVEQQARALGEQWSTVVRLYDEAAATYRMAELEYQRATAIYDETSEAFGAANRAWKRALVKWAIAQQLIEMAARIDAANLDQARTDRAEFSEEDLDCSRVSTRSWRKTLTKQGVDLTGLDVDHIVPRSLGGADHPLNYQLLDQSTNRSLGATWNFEKCASAGPSKCAGAMAVSNVCGNYSPR